MRFKKSTIPLVVSMLAVSITLNGQGAPAMKDVALWMARAEAASLHRQSAYDPRYEFYSQQFSTESRFGPRPVGDCHTVGKLEWAPKPRIEVFAPPLVDARVSRATCAALPENFAEIIFPDLKGLGPDRYESQFVREAIVNSARTLVLDLTPRKGVSDGFRGRVWIEVEGYNVIRFMGVSDRVERMLGRVFRRNAQYRVEGWRTPTPDGEHVPSALYIESVDRASVFPRTKAHLVLWGYNRARRNDPAEFTRIVVDGTPAAARDEDEQFASPVLSQRDLERQAADNFIARLTHAGLLAPPMQNAERVVGAVLTNLLVSRGVRPTVPLQVRILPTTPLEATLVGHYLLISRGAIDVLPDESALALVLSHSLGHLMRGHPLVSSRFAFADLLNTQPDRDLLRNLAFRHPPEQEAEADETAIELLRTSPYAATLSGAGLFLQALIEASSSLPHLVQRPGLGHHLADAGQFLRLSRILRVVPNLVHDRVDQVGALQIGARASLDPWTGSIQLRQPQDIALVAPRERAEFQVTRLVPIAMAARPVTGGDLRR